MIGKMSRRIVIDADVAQAAGETHHPVSSACRRALEDIRKICHRVAMDERVLEEWKKHQSRFAKNWLASMRSKRKVFFIKPTNIEDLTEILEGAGLSGKQNEVALKDLHLVEVAMASDLAIISLDKKARAVFEKVSRSSPRLKKVVWANPTSTELHEWLQSGARFSETIGL
jgi:predicted nucleic acid-binding protein